MINSNMRIIIKWLLPSLLLLLFLVGCTKEYNSDFVKAYSSYLKYSLGDFEVNKEIVKSCPGPIPEVKKYFVWNIKYKDVNGNDKIFVFNNATDESKNNKMGFQVYIQALKICSDEIGTNVCKKYFDYIADESKVSKENLPVTYCIVDGRYPNLNDKFYSDCINADRGIKLKTISAKELKDKWKGEFEISIITAEDKDEEKIIDILTKTKSLLKDYSKYFNIDKVTATIIYSPYVNLYKITYESKTSTFDVENLRQKEDTTQNENEESKYGHRKYIKTYIVNNKKLVWLDGTIYDDKTNMYYLGSYIELLKALGTNVQHTGERVGDIDYKWKIGDDLFEAYIGYPQKIMKNNLVIVTPGAFSSSGGITVKDFELISGATVLIDEENEVVIINSK